MTEDHRRIRLRRVQLMLTQEELGERAGVDARTVRDIETGRTKNPRASTVRLLLDALAAAEEAADGRGTPATVRPRELPPDTVGFTGRAAELAELDRLLELSAQHPTAPTIVTLSGTAGVGKTALAVHWAHVSLDQFPDGQLYLNLRGYDPDRPLPPTEALAALLRSLGMTGAEIPPEQDDRARLFRTRLADQRMLLLLDNALDDDQIRDLLPAAPGCFVLVTSRDSLGGLSVRHGGHPIEVQPLSHGEAQALLRVHLGDRADQDATAALADQCARLPLALRIVAQLAAARPAVTLAELVAELTDEHQRLDLLDSGESHSSARAVFSWSYRQLPEPLARLFRLIGIQPGRDIDLHALAALAGVDLREARRQVAGLARAHLVDEVARGRFAMHDLLRVYARQQADDHDRSDAALTRLFDYYLNAAERAMATFAPYEKYRSRLPEQLAALPVVDSRESAVEWLDAERANLVAAGLHAAAHGRPGHTSHLSGILHRYLSIGAHWADATLLHSAAGETPDADGNRPGLVNYGSVLFRTGRLQEAVEHLQHAAGLLQDGGGSRRDEARVLGNLAVAYSRLGRQHDAIELNLRSLDIVREMGDRYLEAIALENLGLVHQRLGKFSEAFEFQRRALKRYLEFGDPYGEAGVRGNLGVTCSRLGRHSEALDHHQRVLAILRVIGDRQHEAETLNDIGTTLRLAGSPRQAIERHQQALACATVISDRYDQARAHEGAAHSYTALGDLDNARAHFQAALDIHTDLGTSHVHRIAATLQELS